MADDENDNNIGTKIVQGLATMAAAFVARKLLMLAWTKATGKEPPTDPEDPRVALAEAISWSVLLGSTIGTVRVLAVRAVSRKNSADREHASAADR